MEISLSEGNRHLLRPLVLLARDNFRFVGNPEVSIGPGGMRQVIAILSRVNHPPILLGTSSFTGAGWEGAFYPKGMRSADLLAFYAEHFHTVEVDSTFYGCPSARTVNNWAARTPEGVIFSVKVPQVITHEKVLVDCNAEFVEFVER